MIEKLRKLQKEQKTLAKAGGGWPRDKVIEECCEVLMDHIENKDTTMEEIDLLMCLVDKYYGSHIGESFEGTKPIHLWLAKLESKGRVPTGSQRDFLYDLLMPGDMK